MLIASDDVIWEQAGVAARTVSEEIQMGILAAHAHRRELAPLIINSTGGPGSARARLALLHRCLAWRDTELEDGTREVRSSHRPRFRVIRECARTAQALGAVALDPRDRETVLDNPAFDAVTAALILRPLAPERAPHPEDVLRHPGFHPSGRRKRR